VIFALVRHGQTVWNTQNRLQGRGDSALTPLGEEQARRAGRELVGIAAWEVLVCSPLPRTRSTAALIGAEIGLDLAETVPDLIERSYGKAEGMTPGEAAVEWPEGVQMPIDGTGRAHVADTGVPGAETREQVAERGAHALAQLARQYPDRLVVAVAHGTIIRETLNALLDVPVPRIGNGEVTLVDRDRHGHVSLIPPERYGDYPQLRAAAAQS
jgi:broad specificity phosphatase PhoE